MRTLSPRFMIAVLTLLFLAALFPNTRAADSAALFDAGNKFYEGKNFDDAAASYEAVLNSGQASAAVYFNLGNARFKSGHIGRAIAAYRQAVRLTPRDPDVKANLQFARNQVQGPTLRPTKLQRAFGLLSLNEWTGLTAGGLWLTFLALAVMQLRPALRSSLRTLGFVLGGVTLLLSIATVTARTINSNRDVAVVTARDVIIRNGPLDESQTAFTANDGAELRILDRKDDWLQVTDGTRRIGWLKRSEVANW